MCSVAARLVLGGIGVSGDSSCADHNVVWRTRHALDLDHVPSGVGGDDERPDNIVYDITPQAGQMPGVSASGWGHPECSAEATGIAADLDRIPESLSYGRPMRRVVPAHDPACDNRAPRTAHRAPAYRPPRTSDPRTFAASTS
jgi:hypothetical protein